MPGHLHTIGEHHTSTDSEYATKSDVEELLHWLFLNTTFAPYRTSI